MRQSKIMFCQVTQRTEPRLNLQDNCWKYWKRLWQSYRQTFPIFSGLLKWQWPSSKSVIASFPCWMTKLFVFVFSEMSRYIEIHFIRQIVLFLWVFLWISTNIVLILLQNCMKLCVKFVVWRIQLYLCILEWKIIIITKCKSEWQENDKNYRVLIVL